MLRVCRVAVRDRGDRVVPVAVEVVAAQVPGLFRPVLVVTALIVSMMTSWEVSGRPRQFMVIAENSRCSILFHCASRRLEVDRVR